jgi:hypothetical protein
LVSAAWPCGAGRRLISAATGNVRKPPRSGAN